MLQLEIVCSFQSTSSRSHHKVLQSIRCELNGVDRLREIGVRNLHTKYVVRLSAWQRLQSSLI